MFGIVTLVRDSNSNCIFFFKVFFLNRSKTDSGYASSSLSIFLFFIQFYLFRYSSVLYTKTFGIKNAKKLNRFKPLIKIEPISPNA